MKRFEQKRIREAKAYAMEGGQALHLHRMNQGHRLFERYPVIAHLFDQDKARLVETAKKLGVRVIKVERKGEPSQHIDLCGRPLERAKEMCEREPICPSECKHRHSIFIQGGSGSAVYEEDGEKRHECDRERVYLCPDCGQFTIHVMKNHQYSTITFALCTEEMVRAAGQWLRYLERAEQEQP